MLWPTAVLPIKQALHDTAIQTVLVLVAIQVAVAAIIWSIDTGKFTG